MTTTVVAGQTTELPVTLAALPPSVGSMDVVSYPAGASVFLDGSYRGQTSPYDALDIPNIAPGDHALVLALEGYYNYVTTVAVTAGKSTNVVATLTDKPDANQYGQMAVVSSPSGASIYVDGAYRGITPAALVLVRTGDRTVLLRAERLPGLDDVGDGDRRRNGPDLGHARADRDADADHGDGHHGGNDCGPDTHAHGCSDHDQVGPRGRARPHRDRPRGPAGPPGPPVTPTFFPPPLRSGRRRRRARTARRSARPRRPAGAPGRRAGS